MGKSPRLSSVLALQWRPGASQPGTHCSCIHLSEEECSFNTSSRGKDQTVVSYMPEGLGHLRSVLLWKVHICSLLTCSLRITNLTDILGIYFVNIYWSPWHIQSFLNATQQEALRGHYGCKSTDFKHLGGEEAVRISETSNSNLILQVDTLICK